MFHAGTLSFVYFKIAAAAAAVAADDDDVDHDDDDDNNDGLTAYQNKRFYWNLLRWLVNKINDSLGMCCSASWYTVLSCLKSATRN